jgi:mono/diheme cytochrome c family protein
MKHAILNCRRTAALLLPIWCAAAVVSAASLKAQEEDDLLKDRRPALVASFATAAGQVVARREGELPALALRAGETPDPRLPSEEWRAVWTGFLQIRLSGKHKFSARTSGDLEVLVEGKPVLSARPDSQAIATGGEVELPFGRQAIEIRFTQRGAGASLRLFWESEDFPREPLPEYVLGHTPAQGESAGRFVHGQLAIEEHSCIACHVATGDVPISGSLAKRPGPKLTDAGKRLNAAWIYEWLGDPQAYRPEAVMPRLFATDRRGEVERFAVATYLASRGKPSEPRQLNDGQLKSWPKEGQALFETMGCVVCHEKQGNAPPRATLSRLSAKLPVAALAEFLQNPAAVDPGGRMPAFNFRNRDDACRYSASRPPGSTAAGFCRNSASAATGTMRGGWRCTCTAGIAKRHGRRRYRTTSAVRKFARCFWRAGRPATNRRGSRNRRCRSNCTFSAAA